MFLSDVLHPNPDLEAEQRNFVLDHTSLFSKVSASRFLYDLAQELTLAPLF
jgi:hypothetical protein